MIVFIPMCGDLFHWGHVELLKKVKKKYKHSKILVGLHTDDSIKKYKRQPILSYDERYKVIESCRYVHKIISFTCDIIVNNDFLSKYNIDLVVHGHSIEEEDKYKYSSNIFFAETMVSSCDKPQF